MPRLCHLLQASSCGLATALFGRGRLGGHLPSALPATNTEKGFLSFPDSFVFGTATSAYQVEGAAAEGDRSPSVYDKMLHAQPGAPNGDVADDHYHRFRDDVVIMAELGLRAYRFSISWSRVIPRGEGDVVNGEGARFYSDLIDELLRHNIEPWVTIFHWDLPQVLQDEFSGWIGPKERIVPAFGNYARTLFKLYGDRVKRWITLNEPWCVAKMHQLPTMGNYFISGPLDAPYQAGHNLLLAHAEAVRIYRSEFQASQGGLIGITLNLDWNEARNASNPKDVAASQRANDFMLGWFADPIQSGQYPAVMRSRLGRRLPTFTAAESSLLKNSSDFLGVNNYFSKYVIPATSLFDASVLAGTDVAVQLLDDPRWELDDPGRPITPGGFEKLLLYVSQRYPRPGGIFVTENGVAAEPRGTREQDAGHEPRPRPYRAEGAPAPTEDWEHETFEDPRRVRYLEAHLAALHAARAQGADVRGYFVWSLLDNFEWSNYHTRFGIVHVDFETQKRTVKRSGRVYADVIKNGGLWAPHESERYPGDIMLG